MSRNCLRESSQHLNYYYTFMCRVLFLCFVALTLAAAAAPVIDPIPNVTIPAGKSLIIPITATSTNGRGLTYTVTGSTNAIAIVLHTNNPFWKLNIVQAAATNAPGAFATPYRGGLVTVTNMGDMTFMLFPEYAPHTVNVFQGLTASGFYNSNTIFHRVIAGFMDQGGDPNTNGSGGPVFRYDDEFHPQAIFSGSGQLALANSGKDTDGSQFFVTVGATAFSRFWLHPVRAVGAGIQRADQHKQHSNECRESSPGGCHHHPGQSGAEPHGYCAYLGGYQCGRRGGSDYGDCG